MAATTSRSFAFVFPMASGHLNPSLPVARTLVGLGHEVHYLCREQMREAIEDTGAVFHSEVACEPELFGGRSPAGGFAIHELKEQYCLEGEPMMQVSFKLRMLALELQLPGVLRWLQAVKADAILYCPIINQEAVYAGRVLGIPSVALLTTAGPGSRLPTIQGMLSAAGLIEDDVRRMQSSFEPHKAAVQRLNSNYGFELTDLEETSLLGYLPHLRHSTVTLVTTCEALQDPVPPEVAKAYLDSRTSFKSVGALLDKAGACRAVGHKMHQDGEQGARAAAPTTETQVLAAVLSARAAGRSVVLVSMGTVITGDIGDLGWGGRIRGADGVHRGLSGCELCRSAWGGAFDAFGAASPEEGPLLVVALGPQPDALGDLEAPPNALCAPSLPQVDILKAGVELFLTHGGQNSFTEALANGVPLVVCPGFGDQHVNAEKCETLGVGLRVERPLPELGAEVTAAAQYREDVARAMRDVHARPPFSAAAAEFKDILQHAGGVQCAVEVMLTAAAKRQGEPSKAASTATRGGA